MTPILTIPFGGPLAPAVLRPEGPPTPGGCPTDTLWPATAFSGRRTPTLYRNVLLQFHKLPLYPIILQVYVLQMYIPPNTSIEISHVCLDKKNQEPGRWDSSDQRPRCGWYLGPAKRLQQRRLRGWPADDDGGLRVLRFRDARAHLVRPRAQPQNRKTGLHVPGRGPVRFLDPQVPEDAENRPLRQVRIIIQIIEGLFFRSFFCRRSLCVVSFPPSIFRRFQGLCELDPDRVPAGLLLRLPRLPQRKPGQIHRSLHRATGLGRHDGVHHGGHADLLLHNQLEVPGAVVLAIQHYALLGPGHNLLHLF